MKISFAYFSFFIQLTIFLYAWLSKSYKIIHPCLTVLIVGELKELTRKPFLILDEVMEENVRGRDEEREERESESSARRGKEEIFLLKLFDWLIFDYFSRKMNLGQGREFEQVSRALRAWSKEQQREVVACYEEVVAENPRFVIGGLEELEKKLEGLREFHKNPFSQQVLLTILPLLRESSFDALSFFSKVCIGKYLMSFGIYILLSQEYLKISTAKTARFEEKDLFKDTSVIYTFCMAPVCVHFHLFNILL